MARTAGRGKQGGCATGCITIGIVLLGAILAVTAFGLFGLALTLIGATLALISPAYRTWLADNAAFRRRLAWLPGLDSRSPKVLAIMTTIYGGALWLVAWLFLFSSSTSSSTSSSSIGGTVLTGLLGLVVLWGWFIKGWRLGPSSSDFTAHTRAYDEAYFARMRKLDEIKSVDPVAFERFVASLLTRMGYTVSTTPVTGDEGIDLFARKDGRIVIVQCKRYDDSVGQSVVRDLYGAMIHSRADEALLVTTGTISLPARQWASGKPIQLIDGTTLVDWVATVQDTTATDPSAPQPTADPRRRTNLRDIFQPALRNQGALAILVLALFTPLLPIGVMANQRSLSSSVLPTQTSLTTARAEASPTMPTLTTSNAVGVTSMSNVSGSAQKSSISTPIISPTATLVVPTLVPSRDEVTIIEVLSGDTVKVRFGHGAVETIRYLGVEAPRANECFGAESAARNTELVEGRSAQLERDEVDRDSGGTLIRYVWVVSDDGQTRFVNEELVKFGFAGIGSTPSEARYLALLRGHEQDARKQNLGLWGSCRGLHQPLPTPTPVPTPTPSRSQAEYIDPRVLVADPSAFIGRKIRLGGEALNVEHTRDGRDPYTWVQVLARPRGREVTESIVVEFHPPQTSILKRDCYIFYGEVKGTQKVTRTLTGAVNEVPVVHGYAVDQVQAGQFGECPPA